MKTQKLNNLSNIKESNFNHVFPVGCRMLASIENFTKLCINCILWNYKKRWEILFYNLFKQLL